MSAHLNTYGGINEIAVRISRTPLTPHSVLPALPLRPADVSISLTYFSFCEKNVFFLINILGLAKKYDFGIVFYQLIIL